jgi:hypothetical protein
MAMDLKDQLDRARKARDAAMRNIVNIVQHSTDATRERTCGECFYNSWLSCHNNFLKK